MILYAKIILIFPNYIYISRYQMFLLVLNCIFKVSHMNYVISEICKVRDELTDSTLMCINWKQWITISNFILICLLKLNTLNLLDSICVKLEINIYIFNFTLNTSYFLITLLLLYFLDYIYTHTDINRFNSVFVSILYLKC